MYFRELPLRSTIREILSLYKYEVTTGSLLIKGGNYDLVFHFTNWNILMKNSFM